MSNFLLCLKCLVLGLLGLLFIFFFLFRPLGAYSTFGSPFWLPFLFHESFFLFIKKAKSIFNKHKVKDFDWYLVDVVPCM